MCEFFEDRAWRVAEPGALLPYLEALPQHEGEEAHQDMGLQTVGTLVPDRPFNGSFLMRKAGSAWMSWMQAFHSCLEVDATEIIRGRTRDRAARCPA